MDNNGFNEYTPNDPFTPAPPQTERPYYRARDFRAAARKANAWHASTACATSSLPKVGKASQNAGSSPTVDVCFTVPKSELPQKATASE